MNPLEPLSDDGSQFDAVAAYVPENLQARYYRMMARFRQIQPDDEILLVVEAMALLTVLTREVPAEMARERSQLSEALEVGLSAMRSSEKAVVAYHQQLEQRLAALPQEVALGIAPEAIAGRIGEGLRQRFQETGMPEAAEALNYLAARMKQAAEETSHALHQITDPRSGTLPRVDSVLSRMHTTLEHAANHVQRLSADFYAQVERSVYLLTGGGLALGFLLGLIFARWQNS